MKKWSIAVVFLALASGAAAQNPLPDQHNFTFAVDGVAIAGVVGFRIEFAPGTAEPLGPRRLDQSYLPVQRSLYVTVTQKGLNQLQDWLNSVTNVPPSASRTVSVASRESAGSSGNAPTGSSAPATTHSVSITARDNGGTLLVQWALTGVTPNALSSAVAGTITEVDTTIQFVYDTLQLVQASNK
jgi:hypothetical protein